ncbi:MAG: YggS family pyridoxal phosphate-dependent enzyme [Turicibacter sp.]
MIKRCNKMNIKENVRQVREKIQEVQIGDSNVHIVAATKYVTIEQMKDLFDCGITKLGENRVDILLEKKQQLDLPIEWHLIGTLQSRKVKDVINEIDVLHSLDRLSLAKEIAKYRQETLDCFIQVNVSQEVSKHGLKIDEVIPFIKMLVPYEKIRVIGLMTMAPHTEDQAIIRHCFQELRNLQQQIQKLSFQYAPCTELSMGMSNDFVIAIEEGATFIRLGSALFQ